MSIAPAINEQPKLSFEPNRFLSAKQQRRLADSMESPTGSTCCPNCHHAYDIVISRQQLQQGRLSRILFRYLRCRVCEHRFTQLKADTFYRLSRIALATATFVFLIAVPDWLA